MGDIVKRNFLGPTPNPTGWLVRYHWHLCNNITVTDINTSTKSNTIVHDNICGTKYNTIVVTVLLLWSYPGNSTKCDTIVGNSFLWSSICDHHMCFQVVCLSILSVPTLCLKDSQIGNETIHPELLLVRMIYWNKVAWVLATQRQ